MSNSRTFVIPVAGQASAEEILERARDAARGAGILIQGDADAGTFKGTAEGTYAVRDHTVHIEVTKKPAFVPWPMIESQLRKAFS